jgi:hypothetical protein
VIGEDGLEQQGNLEERYGLWMRSCERVSDGLEDEDDIHRLQGE